MHISEKDVAKIARLSRIKVNTDELSNIRKDLMGIFDWIDQLQSIDISHVDLHQIDEIHLMNEREDIINSNATVDEVLTNAPAIQHNMFSVPKVVE